MTKNIKEMWDRVCCGDTRAWQNLVQMYAGLVYTVARRAGLSEPDAEDCAQYTWLTLYKKKKSIKDPSALPAWLIKTTHRQAVSLAKKLSSSLDLDAISALKDPALLPDELVVQLEHQAILVAALKRLDKQCRQLLSALFISGQDISYKSLSRSMGVNPNSFGPLRSRCLLKLKKILEKMGYRWN